jgi:transcription antitermination factor NusG
MPVLPPEPRCFPASLFTSSEEEVRPGRAWCVLHTKPRQEKSLARQLAKDRIPYYLPTISRRNLVRNRVLCSYIPLFPGYVFLLANSPERLRSFETKCVVRSLPVADQDRLWHDLGQVERLIASGAPVDPEARLVPGKLVEIRSGPLFGLKGKILREASGNRFVVQVDFIQRGASVLLSDYSLAAVSSEAAALL